MESVTLTSVGNIKTVGLNIFTDYECLSPLLQVAWGYVAGGESKTVIAYIRSNSTVPITLHMTTANWAPNGTDTYIGLSWNREGYVLGVDEVIPADLVLTVAEDVKGITTFSFDIIIFGEG